MPSSEIDRFMVKFEVDPETRCWNWTASKWPDGYGAFRAGGQKVRAHRWSYEHHRRPIADGLWIDHLCRNRACVNPEHLDAVPPRVNTMRGFGPTALHARKTHCIHGHEFTPENTIVRTDTKGREGRSCRTCAAENPTAPVLSFTCAFCGDSFRRKALGRYRPKFCSRRCAFRRASEVNRDRPKGTRCSQGHEYVPGQRRCRECRRAANLKYKAKIRAATLEKVDMPTMGASA